MLEIPLAFAGFLDKRERVLTRLHDLVRDGLVYAFVEFLYMRNDTIDILLCVRTIVVGLQKDDMRTCLACDIGRYLRFVCYLF